VTPFDAQTTFARLLPKGAAVVAVDIASPDVVEGPELAGAVPQRRREFAAGRLCAARALTELGASGPVGRDEKTREPLWPKGVAGSISHTRALAAAAVTRGPMLGIDLEPQLSADALRDVRKLAISDAEWTLLGADAALATALFSAKESLFKCLWPSTRVFLDFPDAQLVAHDDGTFTLELVPSKQRHRVRYALTHSHAFTVCAGVSPGE
jgi:4'-phosphopantetheinyl transferase EntD